MKPRSVSRNLLSLMVLAASSELQAANFTWDPSQTPVTPSGGTGAWNLSDTFWSNVAADVAWADTTGLLDTATFGGSAGTVTLGTNLGAKGLVFGTSGYTITGSTLTLGSSGINASTLSSGTTTISSAVLLSSAQKWQVGSGSTLAVNGAVTRNTGATLTLQGGGGTFSSSSITNVNGIVGPWAVVSNSGTAANNSANGYTFATVSGGNLVAYTGATSMTLTTAWGGIASGGTGTVNYDISSTAALLGATGLGRNVNTLRYTGGGARQAGNNAGDLLTVNGIMNSGTGAFTLGRNGANVANDYSFGILIGANKELVLGAMTADLNLYSFIKNSAGGASAVTILGNNTVNLASGSNAYTGATTVNGGTLLVSGTGSINTTSGIVVNGGKYLHTSSVASTRTLALSNGTLDGTGAVGAVTVADNASNIVTHGNGGTTVLTLGSLAFGGDSTVNLNLASGVGLNVTGALSTTPANGQVVINATKTGWTLGSNSLIGFGTFGGSTTDFSVGTISGLGARQVAGSILNTGSAIALDVTGDLPVWTGLNGTTWATATTGDNTGSNNWATKIANTATNFWATDTAEFNDTYNLGAGDVAVTNRNVEIQGANVSPGTTTFNNSTGDYTVSSSGGFGIASGTLTKSGSSKVTITSTNTYTGATTINAGTLEIGDGTTDGSISASSGITNNGSLVYNLVGAQSYANLIGGTGSVTKSGAGALTLSAANSYSGGTYVNGGSLQISVSGAPGAAATGAFNLAGDTSLVLNSTANNFNYASSIVLNGADITLSKIGATQTNFTGTITGNGNALDVNTSAGRLYINGNTTNGVSQFNVTGGAMGFDLAAGNNQGGGAAVSVSNGSSLYFANAVVALANNVTLNGGGGQGGLGALYQEGGGSPTLSGVLNLASGNSSLGGNTAGANVGITGQVTGSGALTKIGANTYTLSNAANDYSGGTTIAGGVLAATNSAALGSGVVSVSNVAGAQLQLGAGVDLGNAPTINGGGVAVQGVVYVPTLNADATYSGSISITGVQNAGGHFATNGGVLTLSGAINSSAPVTVRTGTVVVSNTGSSYTALTIQAGTLRLGATNSIPVGATADLGISGAATLDLGGFSQTLSGLTKNANAATVTNSGANDSTLTTTGTTSFGGVIQNGGTNSTALTVSGGILTLSGASTYTGATTVSSGTLLVNGSLGNTAVTVESDATLGGSNGVIGLTSASITVAAGGTLAPGASAGTLTVNGNVTIDGVFAYEYDGATTSADLLDVNGTLTLNSATLTLADLFGNSYNMGDKFTLAAYDTLSGTFSGYADDTTYIFGGGEWLFNYNDATAGLNGGAGASYITMTAIPEPAAALIGGLGLLALLRRRRD